MIKDFEQLYKIASKITKEAPILVITGNWKKLDSLTKVPNSLWSGQHADGYEALRARAIKSHDAVKVAALGLTIRALAHLEKPNGLSEKGKKKLMNEALDDIWKNS